MYGRTPSTSTSVVCGERVSIYTLCLYLYRLVFMLLSKDSDSDPTTDFPLKRTTLSYRVVSVPVELCRPWTGPMIPSSCTRFFRFKSRGYNRNGKRSKHYNPLRDIDTRHPKIPKCIIRIIGGVYVIRVRSRMSSLSMRRNYLPISEVSLTNL